MPTAKSQRIGDLARVTSFFWREEGGAWIKSPTVSGIQAAEVPETVFQALGKTARDSYEYRPQRRISMGNSTHTGVALFTHEPITPDEPQGLAFVMLTSVAITGLCLANPRYWEIMKNEDCLQQCGVGCL
jgi:hypothetical protein